MVEVKETRGSSRVEAFATGIKIESSNQGPFLITDQGTVKIKNVQLQFDL